jgi:phosphoglycerol transferase MdoB-like AlkP superfamily enzyme
MSVRAARIALALYLLAIYATLGVVRQVVNFLRDRGELRASVGAAFVFAATAFLWLIVHDARNRTWRAMLSLLVIGVAYAAVIYPMERAEEKIHFIEYGVVAMLAHGAAPRTWSNAKRVLACALFVTAAGWIDEGIQGLLPSRIYDLRDVAFNAAAGVMALVAIAIFSPRERAMGTNRPEELAQDADH